jgi:hypothetical protein
MSEVQEYVFIVDADDAAAVRTTTVVVASRASVDGGHLLLTMDPHGVPVAGFAPGYWRQFTREQKK